MTRQVIIAHDYKERLTLRKTKATAKRGREWSAYALLERLYISDKGYVGEFFSLVDHKKIWRLLDDSEIYAVSPGNQTRSGLKLRPVEGHQQKASGSITERLESSLIQARHILSTALLWKTKPHVSNAQHIFPHYPHLYYDYDFFYIKSFNYIKGCGNCGKLGIKH